MNRDDQKSKPAKPVELNAEALDQAVGGDLSHTQIKPSTFGTDHINATGERLGFRAKGIRDNGVRKTGIRAQGVRKKGIRVKGIRK